MYYIPVSLLLLHKRRRLLKEVFCQFTCHKCQEKLLLHECVGEQGLKNFLYVLMSLDRQGLLACKNVIHVEFTSSTQNEIEF